MANKLEEGGQCFLEMITNRTYSEAEVAKLKRYEHEADNIAHKTYERMHKTFLTPIDREDIYALVNKMDNILDVIYGTAVCLRMYDVKNPDDAHTGQTRILFQAIQKIKQVVHDLRDVKDSEKILGTCVEIHTLENAGDIVLREIMTDLFLKEQDAIELIKWKEIYERIESAIDYCEDVSHVVQGIVLKYA